MGALQTRNAHGVDTLSPAIYLSAAGIESAIAKFMKTGEGAPVSLLVSPVYILHAHRLLRELDLPLIAVVPVPGIGDTAWGMAGAAGIVWSNA